jgi:hypothetical protein
MVEKDPYLIRIHYCSGSMVEKDPYLIRIHYCFGSIVEKDSRSKRKQGTRIRVCVESRVGLDPDRCRGSRNVCLILGCMQSTSLKDSGGGVR